MIIYIDILIMENHLVNLFFLVITANLLKIKKSYIRMHIASLFGAIYTLSYFIPWLSFLKVAPIKLAFPMIILAIAFKIKNFRLMLKGRLIYIFLSFLLAGLCFSMEMGSYSFFSGLIVENVSYRGILLGIIIILLLGERVVTYIKDRIIYQGYLFKIQIKHHGYNKSFSAFLDSGNELREPVTNLPVIILEGEAAGKELKEERWEYLIPYRLIDGGIGNLHGFIPQEIILWRGKEFESVRAVVCITKETLSKEKEFSALLSRGIV